MTTKSASIVGLSVLIITLYLFVQIVFLDFFNHYGLPFGRTDVDNYMTVMSRGVGFPDHMMITSLSIIASKFMDMSLFLTFFIPLALAILLPLSVFILALFMARDWTVAFYSVMAYVFGTISIQAFGISAMWSQMLATIFIMWAYIFYETYLEKKDSGLLTTVYVMVVLTAVAHIKSMAALAIYGALRHILMGKRQLAMILIATAIAAYAFLADTMFDSYPYTVNISDVLTSFMHPLLWILAVFFILRNMGTKDMQLMTLMLFCTFTFVISYFSVLWRPLLSVIPFLTVFAVMELFRYMRQARPEVGIVLGVVFMIALIIFGFNLTRSSLYAMYEETVPGKFNETRPMDPAYFMSMFSIRDASVASFANDTNNI